MKIYEINCSDMVLHIYICICGVDAPMQYVLLYVHLCYLDVHRLECRQ